MKEFDTLFRLGDQRVAPHTVEVEYDGHWLSIISVYASPGGGRLWAKAPESIAKISFGSRDEMGREQEGAGVVDDISGRLFSLSLNDPKITKFRCGKKVKLLSAAELAAWGVDYSVKFETKIFPPCAESRITPTRRVPTSPEAPVDNSGDNPSRVNERAGKVKFSLGDEDE